jgi:hypothetical protein
MSSRTTAKSWGLSVSLRHPNKTEWSKAEIKQLSVWQGACCKARAFPGEFLKDAVSTAVYLLNRATTKSVINKTPYDACYDKKQVLATLASLVALHM